MASAQVVVIGAGVMGASVAYHLALRGCADLLAATCLVHRLQSAWSRSSR